MNGCHNAPRKDGYFVHVRQYQPDGRYVIVQKFIHDVLSRECRYDFRASDPGCVGCGK